MLMHILSHALEDLVIAFLNDPLFRPPGASAFGGFTTALAILETCSLLVEFADGHDDLTVANHPKVATRIALVDEL